MADQELPEERQDHDSQEVHGRLALPLLIPAVVFLFAVLVVYGLSRIYLELNDYKIGDVTMATPLAIGVALAILLVAVYLAAQRTISVFQIAGIFIVGASLLTAGSIWAAVHEEKASEVHANGGSETPPPNGGPPGIAVSLTDPNYSVSVDPATTAAGDVTFNVTNDGTITHNLRVAETDLAPGDLPIDTANFEVDEQAANVIAKGADLPKDQTETVTAPLAAGSYVLFCNVPGHYEQGMHTGFTVE